MVYAPAFVGSLITHEPFDPRYCPPHAIGYLRPTAAPSSEQVVAGGNAKWTDDYTWVAWFPEKHPVVTLTYNAESFKVKGPGSYRFYHGVY